VNILASKFRLHTIAREVERTVARAVFEAGAEAPPTPTNSLPLDARRLRGIPVVGGRGSMGGHIDGTRPDQSSA